MELKIGVQHAPRELIVENDETVEAIETRLAEAISSKGIFSVTDAKGRRLFVPAERISYVEIGTGVGTVGFR